MARVLMGDFGAIFRLGLWDVFDVGDDLVTEETATDNILERLIATQPDVVVLDLDRDGVTDLVRRIAVEFPAIKVIACSSAQPSMRVFPPFHHGESYEEQLEPALLVDAIRSRS